MAMASTLRSRAITSRKTSGPMIVSRLPAETGAVKQQCRAPVRSASRVVISRELRSDPSARPPLTLVTSRSGRSGAPTKRVATFKVPPRDMPDRRRAGSASTSARRWPSAAPVAVCTSRSSTGAGATGACRRPRRAQSAAPGAAQAA